MANYQRLIPFLLQSEGGLSKNPGDAASADPVPDGSGYHTNKGVTWATFKSMAHPCGYSATPGLFYQMPSDIWGKIMKKGYWDRFWGDKILSQAIADTMLNWSFMSGTQEVIKKVQTLVGVTDDGAMGPDTLAAINAKSTSDDRSFSNDLLAVNKTFFLSLASQDEQFEAGWMNRLNALHAITDPETLNHPSQLFPPNPSQNA